MVGSESACLGWFQHWGAAAANPGGNDRWLGLAWDMDFGVLGPVIASADSVVMSMGGPKQRAVLAMLIARYDRPTSVEILELAVYGDNPPQRARRTIQTYVSALRGLTGGAIVKNGNGWSMTVDRNQIDALRFEDIAASTTELEPEDAANVLRQALELWRGGPYADIEAHGQLDGEILRLQELRLTVLQQRIDTDLELGRTGDLIGEIEGLLTEHPYQERFRAQHMLALYRAGRQSDALASYRGMRSLLVDELGVEPSQELQQLEQLVLQQDDSLARPVPAQGASEQAQSNVPTPATSLLGRQHEINTIRTMVGEHRLVTLTGMGGAGKTRLAIEVANREIADDGWVARFVDLSLTSGNDGVLGEVANALGLRLDDGEVMDQILNHLNRRRVLVVLDNCEHVIDDCAELAEAALATDGQWRMLATSRELLDVSGEHAFPVPALSSEADGPAVALFTDRARAIAPDFELEENHAAIIELCDRLDGLPLAIELAAARTGVMTPGEILGRLDHRFRVLSDGRRRSARSLEDTVDWSFDLLDETEQNFLDSLGVHVGPFHLATAAATGGVSNGEAIELLESLVKKSLVTTVRVDGVTLFRLLETIRSYAVEHLADNRLLEATRDRHLDYHLGAVAQVGKQFWTKYGNEDSWDWDVTEDWLLVATNLEVSLDWAIERRRYVDAADLLVRCRTVWREQLAVRAILRKIERVAEELSAAGLIEDRRRLRIADISLRFMAADWIGLTRAARDAMDAADQHVRFWGLLWMTETSMVSDPAECLRLCEVGESLGPDPFGVWAANRAKIHLMAGEAEEAIQLLEPHRGQTVGSTTEGTMAIALLAAGRAAEALEIAEADRLTGSTFLSLGVLAGICHLELGDRQAAERILLKEARSAIRNQISPASGTVLVGLAALAAADGDAVWATEMLFAAVSKGTSGIARLAPAIGERLGVRAEVVRLQAESSTTPLDENATVYLEQCLVRWERRAA